jgi:hypothetical protein
MLPHISYLKKKIRDLGSLILTLFTYERTSDTSKTQQAGENRDINFGNTAKVTWAHRPLGAFSSGAPNL